MTIAHARSRAPAPDPTGSPLPGPLRLGPLRIPTPVVLAPMAGITNRAFRRLCREQAAAAGAADRPTTGAGSVGRALPPTCLFVSEMVTARALLHRHPQTMRLIGHDLGESPRSVQLYGVDPATVGAAVRLLVTEDRADHVDLNFGCPVPKVTRKGGGAALPWKTELFRQIIAAAVAAAAPGGVPVTVKMRLGVDEDHLTYLEAGRIAEGEGAAAVALHARTAAASYSGQADWAAIARLKSQVRSIPVLGNGDIWSAEDALAMVAATGCDGVVVGRGCLGRPWLFADLTAAFRGDPSRARPGLAQVGAALRQHAEYLVEHFEDEAHGCREIRKHVAWYLKGFPVGGAVRHALALVERLADLDRLIADLDGDAPWPGDAAEGQRGRAGSSRRVALPAGWLDTRELTPAQATLVRQAESEGSGDASGG